MVEQVVRMLCAGLVRGDLSEFNILVGAARAAELQRQTWRQARDADPPQAGASD